MKIDHIISAKLNRGPVSVVKIILDNNESEVVRISPRAKMGRVAKVNESDVIDQIYASAEDVITEITDDIARDIEDDIVLWANQHGIRGNAVGWRDNQASLFPDVIARDAWQEEHRADLAPAPTNRRRRIMLG